MGRVVVPIPGGRGQAHLLQSRFGVGDIRNRFGSGYDGDLRGRLRLLAALLAGLCHVPSRAAFSGTTTRKMVPEVPRGGGQWLQCRDNGSNVCRGSARVSTPGGLTPYTLKPTP